ncbi:hypothetical protein ACFL14_01175 [Patescibacteria group bacterium]
MGIHRVYDINQIRDGLSAATNLGPDIKNRAHTIQYQLENCEGMKNLGDEELSEIAQRAKEMETNINSTLELLSQIQNITCQTPQNM